jgi:hypothetical protein
MNATLIDLARAVVPRVQAPASFVSSRVIGLDADADPDVDEWVALDVAVARRMAEAGDRVLLRVGPGKDALQAVPRIAGLQLEAVVRGADEEACRLAAVAVRDAVDDGLPVRAVFATGDTGIDAYRAAAIARRILGTRVPIRVRWDDVLDVKGAALALSFGADELVGPLAPEPERKKLAQIGGPPEDVSRPSPWYVEQLIKAAGRQPGRRPR